MKKKDILTITTVALGTAALTVVTFWSGPIDAGVDPEGPAVRIVQPKLDIQGLELSVAYPGKERIKAEDRPQFQLKAVNTTAEAKTTKVCVLMTATAPVSPFSRAIPVPTVVWQQEEVLTLKAHETREIPLTVSTGVPANKLLAVQLAEGEPAAIGGANSLRAVQNPSWLTQPSIVAFTFSTETNSRPSTLAAAKLN